MADHTKLGEFNHERARQQREQLALSVLECAVEAELDAQRYERFEAGREQPSPQEIPGLAQVLDCTSAYLLNITATPHQQVTAADFPEGFNRIREGLRDPEYRQHFQIVMQARAIIEQQAQTNVLHRLLKPIRFWLVATQMLEPKFFEAFVLAAYRTAFFLISLIALLLLHLSFRSGLIVAAGLLVLSALIAPPIARLTSRLAIPTSLRGQD